MSQYSAEILGTTALSLLLRKQMKQIVNKGGCKKNLKTAAMGEEVKRSFIQDAKAETGTRHA